MDHLHGAYEKSSQSTLSEDLVRQMGDTSPMNDSTQTINVGLVGSLTMIFLTLAVTLLCISFYRRYKRMQNRQEALDTSKRDDRPTQ